MNCVPRIISQIPGILAQRLGTSSGMRGLDSRYTVLLIAPYWFISPLLSFRAPALMSCLWMTMRTMMYLFTLCF